MNQLYIKYLQIWESHLKCVCAKISLTNLAGGRPVVEGEPIPLRSESCVIVGNEYDEA